MKAIKFLGGSLLFIIFFGTGIPFQSCEPDDGDRNCDTCNMLYKPNIYIYPTEKIQLTVKIDFPSGGNIVTSIPEYGKAWNVSVDTNGIINNAYSYLFYESTQPDFWQRNTGWIVNVNDLESFFRKNMSDYGFYGQEIQDFIDYWIPRLESHKNYSIYPQTAEIIDDVIVFSFSKQPENILRLYYIIKGADSLPVKLIEPVIVSFKREGYFVTEWGVILK